MIRTLAALANPGDFVGRGKERGNKSVLILNLHLDPQMCRTGLTTTLSLDKHRRHGRKSFFKIYPLCSVSVFFPRGVIACV